MERLTPPDLVVIDEPEPGWLTIPVEGLKRDAFVKSWVALMIDTPPPEYGALKTERPGWSGELGRATWLRTTPRFTATTALLMSDRTIQVADPDAWSAVALAWTRYVEPLARYTAGWTTSLKAWHPSNARGEVGLIARSARIKVATQLRLDMTGRPILATRRTPIPSVIADDASLTGFLTNPSARHERDRYTAAVTYLHALPALIENNDKLTRDEMITLTDYVDDLFDDPAVPMPFRPTPRFIAECERIAKERTEEIARELDVHPNDAEYFSVAYVSMVTTQKNRLLRGADVNVTPALLRRRIRDKKVDEYRKQTARTEAEGKTAKIAAGKRPTKRKRRDSVESLEPQVLSALIKTADWVRRHYDPGADATSRWAKQVAIDILPATDGPVNGLSSSDEIRPYAESRWIDENVTGAATEADKSHARRAAQTVLLIIDMALSSPDDPTSDDPESDKT